MFVKSNIFEMLMRIEMIAINVSMGIDELSPIRLHACESRSEAPEIPKESLDVCAMVVGDL